MAFIDKLALVSTFLFEKRIVDQRKEIERLRLELFWKDHSMACFTEAMGVANARVTACICETCAGICRDFDVDRDKAVHTTECKFARWFDETLVECDLLAVEQTSLHRPRVPIPPGPWRVLDGLQVDSHFVYQKKGTWICFCFGERALKATTKDDPELRKLARLMKILMASGVADE
jgi:uncharacterized small protein (DUF1192 family)